MKIKTNKQTKKNNRNHHPSLPNKAILPNMVMEAKNNFFKGNFDITNIMI